MQNKVIIGGAVWLSALIALAIVIPGLLVKKIPGQAHSGFDHESSDAIAAQEEPPVMVPIYLTRGDKVESIPLEDYVRGVVAAEMPIEFELEALKAQAMAARTYLVKRIVDHDFSNVPAGDALVTDTVNHQAFLTQDDLKSKWPSSQYAANLEKLNRAVNETKDLVLTYEGQPINATFFSTSNGYTENSEDYWSDYTPYLRSVPSPWDVKLSPKYKETVSLDYRDVLRKLGVSTISPVSTSAFAMKVLERTEGHRIKKLSIGNKIFTGREVREKLGLNSSQFEWKWNGNRIEFTTYGYGHGVGMSQWGADGMAKEGKTAEQIVKYYYTGIEISHATAIVNKK